MAGQAADVALQIGHGQRLGGKIALEEMAALRLQEFQLLAGLDPLGRQGGIALC